MANIVRSVSCPFTKWEIVRIKKKQRTYKKTDDQLI